MDLQLSPGMQRITRNLGAVAPRSQVDRIEHAVGLVGDLSAKVNKGQAHDRQLSDAGTRKRKPPAAGTRSNPARWQE
jgi:hypothetical protein